MKVAEPYLREKLQITRTIYVPPRKLKHKTYSESYTEISAKKINRLYQIYKYDIELFEYPKTPFT